MQNKTPAEVYFVKKLQINFTRIRGWCLKDFDKFLTKFIEGYSIFSLEQKRKSLPVSSFCKQGDGIRTIIFLLKKLKYKI